MAEWHYCWRCKGKMPLLDRDEWELLEPLLRKSIANVKAYRERHNAPLSEAVTLGYGADALAKYRELTGYEETNVNALWHHRLDNFGPPVRLVGGCLGRRVRGFVLSVVPAHNKQLQRTVTRRRGNGTSAPLHYALVPRFIRQRAAAELRR